MTEITQVHAAVRRHLGPLMRLVPTRVPERSRLPSGMPDWHWTHRSGKSGWIEDKIVPSSGKAPDHFTLDQLMWGEEEVAAGGRWHLLGLVESRPARWVLYDAPRARAWFEERAVEPLLSVSGSFPTTEVLHALIVIFGPFKPRAHIR